MVWPLINVIPIYFLLILLIMACSKVLMAVFLGNAWMTAPKTQVYGRLSIWQYKLRWINLWAGIIGVSSWRERLMAFSNLSVVSAAGQRQLTFLTTQQFIHSLLF